MTSFFQNSRPWPGAAIAIAAMVLTPLISTGAAEKSGGGTHCLWRVTDAKAPFYIVGSMHSLPSSAYSLPAVTEKAIKESQDFYFETDPKRDAEFARKMGPAAEYPRGIQIKSKVRPETFKYLLKITQSGAGTWQHLKPWAIAMFMLHHPLAPNVSYAYGIESHITQKIRMRSHSSYGLESIDEHIAVFSGMNDAESEVYLLEALVFGSTNIKQFPATLAAWKAGDTQKLYALYRQSAPEIAEAPHLHARILHDRNVRWIPKIEAAIKSGRPTMVVAGALHFSGPGNVLDMLRARGHHIEQL